MFTYFANPLFLYTMLNSIFNSFNVTIKLMIIHYLSNIIIYLIFKKKILYTPTVTNNTKFDIAGSIKKAMTTTTMVLGAITFYLVISDILQLNIFLRGLLEMTQGLNALIGRDLFAKEILAIIFLSFGGLSVHTQVKCILDETDLKYKCFFIGRIYQTLIAVFLTIIT